MTQASADSAENCTLTRLRPAGEWYPAFLAMLRESANVRLACGAAGIHRQTAYAARQRDAQFRADWDDAIEDACDLLAANAWAYARDGNIDLIKWLLAAHRREVYGQQVRVDITATIRQEAESIADKLGVPVDDLLARAERIAARIKR